MQLIETLHVSLAQVQVEDDWREGLDSTVVDGIARQVAAGHPVNPIRIDDQYRLTQGRHRLAGHFNAGVTEVLAQVVQYENDREREEDTLLENLCRRTLTADERDRGLARLFELAMESSTSAANDAGIPQSAEGSRQKKTKFEIASDVAAKTNQKQSTVERAVRKQSAPHDVPVIVPKPPKPKSIEERLAEYSDQLEVLRALIYQCTQEMESAADQFGWSKSDVRRRIIQDVSRALSQVAGAKIGLGEVSARMKKAKVNVFTAPTRQLGDKPPPGPGASQKPLGLSDPPKTGLKAPARAKRVQVVDDEDRPLLPQVEETANAWADAARVGVGPSQEEDDAF